MHQVRTPGPELRRSVEALYTAFRPWPALPSVVAGCSYCFTAADEAALRVEPEDLTAAALAQFIGHPPDHYDAYQHLLRRFFAPVASALASDQLHVDAGLVLRRLAEAAWTAWPEHEQAAVRAYLRALLEDVLTQPKPPQDGLTAEEVLSGAASATGTTREWLELIDSIISPWKADHLQSVALLHGDELLEGPDAQLVGWWPDDANAELARWFASGSGGRVLRERGATGQRHNDPAALALLTALQATYGDQ